jgi:hypothetical protein
MLPRVLLVIATLGWALGTEAADEPLYGPAPDLVRPVEMPSVGTSTTAAVEIQVIDQQVKFSAANTQSHAETMVTIQSPQGLTAMGTLTVQWRPDTDVLTINKLHILRAGQIIDVLAGEAKFTVLRREAFRSRFDLRLHFAQE